MGMQLTVHLLLQLFRTVVLTAGPIGGETITVSGSNFQNGATTIGGTKLRINGVSNCSKFIIQYIHNTSKTAGDYDLVLTNANGLSATLTALTLSVMEHLRSQLLGFFG